MRNIFLLPTKKSRLHDYDGGQKFALSPEPLEWRTAMHIYVTTDEEVMAEDWCLVMDSEDYMIRKVTHSYAFNPNYVRFWDGVEVDRRFVKKLVFSSNTKLVSLGVQIAPEEFLQWFVKYNKFYVELEKEHDALARIPILRYTTPYQLILPEEAPKEQGLPTGEVKSLTGLSFKGFPILIVRESDGEQFIPVDNGFYRTITGMLNRSETRIDFNDFKGDTYSFYYV